VIVGRACLLDSEHTLLGRCGIRTKRPISAVARRRQRCAAPDLVRSSGLPPYASRDQLSAAIQQGCGTRDQHDRPEPPRMQSRLTAPNARA
jgi:hypothetical protein